MTKQIRLNKVSDKIVAQIVNNDPAKLLNPSSVANYIIRVYGGEAGRKLLGVKGKIK